FLMNATRERFERTYTEQFYSKFSRTADAGEATLAVLPGVLGLIIIAFVLLWMAGELSGRRRIAGLGGSLMFPTRQWRPALSLLMWLIIGALIAVPLASLF